jgi:2-hydroxychromene-2-carboxylate isomerase
MCAIRDGPCDLSEAARAAGGASQVMRLPGGGAVEVVFFFDFASVGSYLLAAQLRPWAERFGVTLRPYPVDSAALAALSGEPTVRHAEAGARYERADAQRWAVRLGVGLRWSAEPPKSGLALRVSAALAHAHPEVSWAFISAAFSRAWADGAALDEPGLRALLGVLLGADLADVTLRAATAMDAFSDLEEQTRRAQRLGLFDVPTLRVGDALFVGHDRLAFASAAVLEARLSSAHPGDLIQQLALLLLDLDDARRQRFIDLVAPAASLKAPEDDEVEDEGARVQSWMEALAHVLSSQRPTSGTSEPARAVTPTRPLALALWWAAQDEPLGALQARLSAAAPLRPPPAAEGALIWVTLAWGGRALVSVEASGAALGAWAAPVRLLMSARTPHGRARALLCEPQASPVLASHGPGDGGEVKPLLLEGGWRVCVLDGVCAEDQALHLAAARHGAHILVLCGLDDQDPRPLASARATGRWVIAYGPRRLRLCDGQGQWALFDAQDEGGSDREGWWAPLTWPPLLSASAVGRGVRAWQVPDARAVLLNELPVVLGPPNSDAELQLACRGHSLRLEIASMRSTISPGRPFEVIRLDAGPLVIIPVFGDQVRAADLLADRVLRALSRATTDCALLIVNYWPEAEAAAVAGFALDMAAAAVEHQAPVAVIVGERPIDLWHREQDEPRAYRIEPEGDLFHFDITLQPSIKARQRQALARVGAQPQRYVDMLFATTS